MNAKVNEILADTRRTIIEMTNEIDANASLKTIQRQVGDAVGWFHIYLDYIACFHEAGEISDEEEEYLTRSAYAEFYN